MRLPGLAASFLLLAAPLTVAAQDTFVCQSKAKTLHQLRIYEVNRANREPFHQRFQDHALRLMKKCDFKVLDLWESDTGEKLQLIYLLEWPDAKTMDQRWQAFLADQEWMDVDEAGEPRQRG
jgi:NIPSNAP